eukprot:m.246176 g.246176  ORF g.246176 m.246176 type:complete len:319 (+) comp19061_c1_seq9:252-1208(+)
MTSPIERMLHVAPLEMSRTPSDEDLKGTAAKVKEEITIAVPKKGRLHERILKLINGCGLEHVRTHRLDIAPCMRLPVTIVFLPAADIAQYVGEGNIDMGITGQDIVAESGVPVEQLMLLGFGKCSLCVQAPSSLQCQPEDLAGKRIVTSFPNLSRQYFDKLDQKLGTTTKVKYVSGSVEAACGLGLADGIVDLVETGTTMKAAGLEKVDTVMSTQTVLICNPHSVDKKLVRTVHKRIEGYITAQQSKMISYNVHRSSLPEVLKITPGRESATVTDLAAENFVSVSALVKAKEAGDIMDSLQEAGAQSILLFDVANCRF